MRFNALNLLMNLVIFKNDWGPKNRPNQHTKKIKKKPKICLNKS